MPPGTLPEAASLNFYQKSPPLHFHMNISDLISFTATFLVSCKLQDREKLLAVHKSYFISLFDYIQIGISSPMLPSKVHCLHLMLVYSNLHKKSSFEQYIAYNRQTHLK